MDEFTHLPSSVQVRHLPSVIQKDITPLEKAYRGLHAPLRLLLPPVPQATSLKVFDIRLIGRPNVHFLFLLKVESFNDEWDFANWVMTDRKTAEQANGRVVSSPLRSWETVFYFSCSLSPHGIMKMMTGHFEYQSNLQSSNPATILFFAGKSGTTLSK